MRIIEVEDPEFVLNLSENFRKCLISYPLVERQYLLTKTRRLNRKPGNKTEEIRGLLLNKVKPK